MTSVVMIFEMTQDYAVIVPLMISNLVSFFISSRLQRMPIYEELAIQDGIHLPSAESRQRNGHRRLARIMRQKTESLAAELTVQEALQQCQASRFRSWLVMDGGGVRGVITRQTLESEFTKNADKKLQEISTDLNFPHVHADQSLDTALERMGGNQLDLLPVVNRANVHKLEGVVTLSDVLMAYGIRAPF
jgi:CIC family chloride channel protein